MFKDETPPPQRSSNSPEELDYWFFYPFRYKHAKYPSPVIFLEEDKKPFQKVEEENSSKNIKDKLSYIKSKNSKKYKS
jgi:hypothetical protein